MSSVLGTEVRRRVLRRLWASRQAEVEIEYLSHNDFTYHVKVLNRGDRLIAVTVRIFLVPARLEEDRRAWIEMDKFLTELQPGPATIKRHSRESSVIRHPVLTTGALEREYPAPDERGTSLGCRCGWPYTLLLPRGTKDNGMTCRLLVMVSPGEDLVGQGTADADLNYPDKRAMGYPFDRSFEGSVIEALKGLRQVNLSEFQIVHS
jgi:hypothetical protein